MPTVKKPEPSVTRILFSGKCSEPNSPRLWYRRRIILRCTDGHGAEMDKMSRVTLQKSVATRSLLGTDVAVALHKVDLLYVADIRYLSLYIPREC
jgi:hypothetical protein